MARPQRLVSLTLIVAALCVGSLLLLTWESTGGQPVADLRIALPYRLVQETRIGPLVFAIYRARVRNAGLTDFRRVRATLIDHPHNVLVLDRRLNFGTILAGKTVTSRDTFVIVRKRHVPFNPAALVWEITGTPVLMNHPPVARAGRDQTVVVGQTVILDGSKSSDADGDPLQYHWSFVTVPAGSAAVLDDPHAVRPTFVVDRRGSYVIELIVNDGTTDSEPDTVTITTRNSRPVANAGPDQTVFVGDTVQLDGSASSDVDGDALTFTWTILDQPDGSTAALSDPHDVTPTFEVDRPGTYVVQLIVTDGLLESIPDTVSVTTENSTPVARAGEDQTVFVGDTVQLDGSLSSDVDGDPLTFQWAILTQPMDSTAELSDSTLVNPTFEVDQPGLYVVQLMVNDGTANSDPDTVSITTQNSRPVADAGPDQMVFVGDTVQLDGSLSHDADGDPLTYRWSLSVTPAGSLAVLSDPNAVDPTFVVDLPGMYVAQLMVHDGQLDSVPDTVTITTRNRPPVLEFIADQRVVVGTTLTLQLSTTDPDGDALTFAVDPLPANASLNVTTGLFTFTPADAQVGMLQLTFKVSDRNLTDDQLVNITVERPAPLCPPPTIATFAPASGPVGTEVIITGSNFVPAPECGTGPPQVALNKLGGGTIAAPIARFDATSIAIVLPAGAASGLVTITVAGQSATSAEVLTILPSSSFTLSAAPSTADVIQGHAVSYVATLSSNGITPFTQLATLTVAGLPAGVTASFTPSQATAGQTALLTVTAANTASPTTGIPLTVTASATVDGIVITQSVNLTLNVHPVTTTFMGRIVLTDALQTPLAGVTITMLGRDGNGNPTGCTGQTVSDAAGNFMFTNLPPECTGGQLIRYDGSTAAGGQFAGVDKFYDLTANQVTTPPLLVHLPRIDNAETIPVQQNAPVDQVLTFATIPNLQVIVYAGTIFTLEDGSQPDPFPFTAVQVPLDRLPGGTMPPNDTTVVPFLVGFQPANTTANQPAAVYFPNLLNNPPGTTMTLITLDPTLGMMVPYGTGTVADNGTQIVPDLDPARPGRRFGLVHLGWHGPTLGPPPPGGCKEGCCDARGGSAGGGASCIGCTPFAGMPVNLSFGEETLTATDITINGPRGAIAIIRTYRTFSRMAGPFGIGTNHNYGFLLDTDNTQGSAVINLVMPDRVQFPFVRQGDGTLINSTIPALRGAVMRVVGGGQVDLRWKDGTTFRFSPRSAEAFGFRASSLESITDTNGNTVSLVRNPSRPIQITEVIDPVGRKLSLSYDGANRITAIVDPIGRTVQYTYNVQETLETVTDPEGGITRYDYDAQNRILRITDARGMVVAQNTYDANGRVIEQVQADGGVLRFAYTILNPQIPLSPVLETVLIDALGRQTTYRFNLQGFLLDVTDALGQITMFEREPGTNILLSAQEAASCSVCVTPSAGGQSFTYDANGNVLTRTDALGNTTTFTYDPVFNKVTSITDPLNHTTTFTYDVRGNLTARTDENNHTTSFAYNPVGLLTEITDPLNQRTTFAYDSFGNLVAITDPLEHTTSFRYDAISRQIEAIDALGRKSSTTYDKLGRVIAQTNAKNDATTFTYDPVGNLLSVTDARNKTTTFTYDAMSRLLTKTTPLGKTDTRNYDLNGNLVESVDRRGQTNQYVYDAFNRLISETYADGSGVARVYDAHSRLVHVNDAASGVFTFTYDLVGRTTSATGPFGTVDYAYNPIGRVTSRQVIGQPPVTYAYDAAGNLLQAATPQATASFSYDTRNQLAGITRSNGVTTTYQYDPAGRVTALMHANGATILNAQSYTYDAIGNRTHYTTDIAQPLITQPRTGVYDDDNRLVQSGTTTYGSLIFFGVSKISIC